MPYPENENINLKLPWASGKRIGIITFPYFAIQIYQWE